MLHFSDELPPMSVTIYSTWKLKHSDAGIVEDPAAVVHGIGSRKHENQSKTVPL